MKMLIARKKYSMMIPKKAATLTKVSKLVQFSAQTVSLVTVVTAQQAASLAIKAN